MKKEKVSRRDFLKKSATVAGAAAAGTFLGGKAPLFVKNAFAGDPLRVIGLEIGPIPPIMKKASEDLGFEVVPKGMSNQAMVLMGTTAPDEFDLAEEYYNDLGAVWPAGNYQPETFSRSQGYGLHTALRRATRCCVCSLRAWASTALIVPAERTSSTRGETCSS